MAEDALRDFVVEAGRRLNRPPEEVEPYAKILTDNWFDSPESLADTKPEELANQGIPLRFAKELISAAARGFPSGRRGTGKGKGKGEGKDPDAPVRGGDGEFKQSLELWEHDAGFNLRGAVIGEKGRNVHHIQDQTGARLWVQGEPGEPLRVELSAGGPRELQRAVRLTRDLLGAVRAEYEEWLRREGGGWRQEQGDAKGRRPEKGRGKGKARPKGREEGDGRQREAPGGREAGFREVLELWECEPAFNLKGKIIGDSGRNVHHIQDQTGAKLWLSGDPMQLEVCTNSPEDLERAVNMAQDLLGAVYDEYTQWLGGEGEDRGPREAGKGMGKGKDKGKDAAKGRRRESGKGGDGDFMKILKLKDTEPAFRLRGALIGDSGRNVHHIQDQTGAKLWLHGDSGQSMRLEITANSSEALDQAVQMSKDLIKTVYQSYDEWLQDGGGRDKGSGKGRHQRHEDEPPAKRRAA